MSTNKNLNTTKSNVEDVFKNLKYVDALMNEAAKTKVSTTVKESFEGQLKAKLMEGDYKETSEMEENRYTDKQNNNYPTYNYNEAGEDPATPPTADAPEASAPEAGLPADTTGMPAGPDAAATAGLPIDTTGGTPEAGADATAGLPVDMTGEPGAGDMGDLPVDTTGGGSSMSMGGGAPAADMTGAAPDAGASAGIEGGIESPEDIEALVDQLIDKDIEQTNESSMGVEETLAEGTNKTNPTEKIMENNITQTIDEVIAEITKTTTESVDSKPAGAETLTSTVAKAANVDQTKSQGDATTANIGANYEDLGDNDLEGKVSHSGSAKTTSEDFSKVGAAKKVDQTKGQGDANNANLGADYKGLGDKDLETKMKNEAVLKSKALFVLAEKYLKLEDELKAVKFENYKSLKANGILTLAPNLSEATKISLIKKFDECKTYKATESLYEDVIKLIKDDKKGNIAEATRKDTSVKVITEKKNEKPGEKKETLTEAEKRIRFLSGAKGFGDQYFHGTEI